MFQSVRPNSQIYIFHKGDNPFVETGVVTNQPVSKPKYNLPLALGQPQELVVDFVVRVNDHTVNYNGLPAQLDVADTYSNGESIVVSVSKEALNSEIIAQKQKYLDEINRFDYDKEMVEKYEKLLSDFNPEFAEKQAQKEEIISLKSKIDEMSKGLEDLMLTNRKLIEQLSLKGGQ
jgi:hypothetical protein